MADKKVSVDSKILPVLHKKMKDDIKKKALDKNWNETEKEHFVSGLLKLYKETVELALRENVVVSDEEKVTTSCSTAKQEMVTLDKEWAKQVNEMCAKSEDLLTYTVKKRKYYPQKIKDHLHKNHATELINLQKLEAQIASEKNNDGATDNQAGLDMEACESSWSRLKQACEDHSKYSKSLLETKEKFERFNAVAKMKLKMKDNDLNRTLLSKRKLPSSFDSILATPSKEVLDDTIQDSNNTSTIWTHNACEKQKILKGCVRKKSPDRT